MDLKPSKRLRLQSIINQSINPVSLARVVLSSLWAIKKNVYAGRSCNDACVTSKCWTEHNVCSSRIANCTDSGVRGWAEGENLLLLADSAPSALCVQRCSLRTTAAFFGGQWRWWRGWLVGWLVGCLLACWLACLGWLVSQWPYHNNQPTNQPTNQWVAENLVHQQQLAGVLTFLFLPLFFFFFFFFYRYRRPFILHTPLGSWTVTGRNVLANADGDNNNNNQFFWQAAALHARVRRALFD